MESVKVIAGKVGYVSLVGIMGKNYPLSFGNYFSLGYKGVDDMGYHVLNMWHENLEHLIETGVIKADDELEGMAFGRGIVLTDSKIPRDYLNKKMCFTGSHGGVGPTKELYNFFYKQFQGMDCMCNEEAEYCSMMISSMTMGDYPMKLSLGYCHICGRKIHMNHGKEITPEEYGLLYEQFNKLAFGKKDEFNDYGS